MNTSLICGWLAFMPCVSHTARLRRAAGCQSEQLFVNPVIRAIRG
jgi:hypothetical protein